MARRSDDKGVKMARRLDDKGSRWLGGLMTRKEG
jgi:hypothetical protein